jgi:glutamine amidotransferase
VAYLGPPIPLARLLFEPPHSLEHQSWAPADMRGGGTINADGYGIGWFPSQAETPLRYRRDRPLWTDVDLRAIAAATSSGAILAAVRSATPGMPVTETAAAPFLTDRWLFSHNGKVAGWPDRITGLAATLPTRDLLTLDAPTDSALLWALVRHHLRAGAAPGEALRTVVAEVRAEAPGSRLNLLLTDGVTVAATVHGHALSVLQSPDSVLVASEPLFPSPAWRAVPDDSLVVAAAPAAGSTVDILTLEGVSS